MSDEEIIELATLYASQSSISLEKATEAIAPWSFKFKTITLSRAKEAFLELIADGGMPRTARHGDRVIAIAKRAEMPVKPTVGEHRPFAPGHCDQCADGFVEVPHPKDYDMSRYWRGQYICMVTCSCPAGQRQRGHRSLFDYELEFRHWREEYPIRRFEFKVNYLTTRIENSIERKEKKSTYEHLEKMRDRVMNEWDQYIQLCSTQPPQQGEGHEQEDSSLSQENVDQEGRQVGEAHEGNEAVASGVSFPH